MRVKLTTRISNLTCQFSRQFIKSDFIFQQHVVDNAYHIDGLQMCFKDKEDTGFNLYLSLKTRVASENITLKKNTIFQL